MTMRRSILLAAAAPALLFGCMPDVPGPDPEPAARVAAVFDPGTATIPLPNSAALEEDGTLPRLDGAGDDDANGAFLAWLDGLHGWSEATPITIPFSGELDPSTVTPDNVKMWEHGDGAVTEVALAATQYVVNDESDSVCNSTVCGAVIVAVPESTPKFGTRYSVVVTKDVKGANGEEVAESTAGFFAASNTPLIVDGEPQNDVLDVPTATQLEGLRQLLAPTFAAAAEAGIPRNRIASAQTWTVAEDPFTVLDPATATIPIPNTLAIEPDGTFPSAALNYCGGPGVDPATLADTSCDAPDPEYYACEVSADCDQYRETGDPAVSCIGGRCMYPRCAQGAFDAYLDQLHGWPTTTPITLPVNGEIDETTLNDETVQLWAIIDDVPTKVEGTTVAMDPCGRQITITLPPEAPAMGYATNYIAFATKEVKGTNGYSLLPPAALVLAMMPHEPGEFVGTCTAEEAGQACADGGVCAAIPGQDYQCVRSLVPNASDANAASVMAIRPLFQPIVAAASAAAGVSWDELASIWTWQTWTDTFVVFDPSSGNIPFPHTLLTAGCPDGEPICNLPAGEGATAPLLAELRRREGFSSTAPHWIPTLGPPLDPASITTSPQAEAGILFAEANVIPPPLFPTDQWSVAYEFGHIIARFARPLRPDTLVAGLTTTNLIGANGHPAQPTPAFVFLRSEFPLVDENGVKTIAQIPDDATAQLLEASREDFEQLFLVALLFGYSRDQVNNAWAFVTDHSYRPLQELRARTLHEMGGTAPVATANSPDVVTNPATVPHPDMVTVDIDTSNIAEIHWNVEFQTYWWLNADNTMAAAPTRADVGVSIFVPEPAGGCNAPYDVVIAQHGYTNYRKNMGLSVANEMAGRCIATIAMDLPLHGGRITGSPELHPASRPATSGDGFISEDFVGTVGLLKQATIDEIVLIQMLKQGAFDDALNMTFTDATSQIGFVGNSLGGFVGSLVSTIEPELGPAMLNVVGGQFGVVLKESDVFNPLLVATGIPADSFEELQALHFVQWLGEHVDPYAFAPYPKLAPIDDLTFDGTDFVGGAPLPAKDMMIQMVTDDPTIPNSATEPVARVMGVDLTDTTFPATVAHGFLSDIDPNSAGAPAHDCAVTQAAEWISSSFAGAAAITTPVSACGL